MSEFRTVINIKESKSKISISDRILTAGSCFAEVMGAKFRQNKFQVEVNPFGTLYSPLAIHSVIASALSGLAPSDDGFIRQHEISYHYDYHSSLSASTPEELRLQISDTHSKVLDFLKKARWLIITYGTSWIYTRKDIGAPVANCHKMPANLFDKSLLTQKRILESFSELYSALKQLNPELQIILTVSPVRHLKDTLELNSVSKAILRIACHTLSTQHADVYYFPSFEIMMDDLRDYRFYKADMIHPTEQAESIIWDMFAAAYMDGDTKKFLETWKTISASLAHKPFHSASEGHQQFLRKVLITLEELKTTVDVEKEIAYVNARLTN